MNAEQVKEIVPPETHSTGPDLRKVWSYIPRWLQIALLAVLIFGGILVLIFMK
jgi:hypothetical protein